MAPPEDHPLIRAVALQTAADLEGLRVFYGQVLGLNTALSGNELTVIAGPTQIRFRPAELAGSKPNYHI